MKMNFFFINYEYIKINTKISSLTKNIHLNRFTGCTFSESDHSFDRNSQSESRIKIFFQQQQTEVQDGEIQVMKMAKFSFKM